MLSDRVDIRFINLFYSNLIYSHGTNERSTLGQGGRTRTTTASEWSTETQKHAKAAYSTFTAYLRSCIKMRHLRRKDRADTVFLGSFKVFLAALHS